MRLRLDIDEIARYAAKTAAEAAGVPVGDVLRVVVNTIGLDFKIDEEPASDVCEAPEPVQEPT